jgi:hypothetical protein
MAIEADSNYDCLISAKKKRPGNGSLYLKACQRSPRTNGVVRPERRDGKAPKGKCLIERTVQQVRARVIGSGLNPSRERH